MTAAADVVLPIRSVQLLTQKRVGIGGTCWQMCVAMLLGLDESEADLLPHFMRDVANGREGILRTKTWASASGLRFGRLFWTGSTTLISLCERPSTPRFFIASGPSPREPSFGHSIVVDRDELRALSSYAFLDPHPSRAGLSAFWDAYGFLPALT